MLTPARLSSCVFPPSRLCVEIGGHAGEFRAKGPSHTSLGQRPRIICSTKHEHQRRVSLRQMRRAFSPWRVCDLAPWALPKAGLRTRRWRSDSRVSRFARKDGKDAKSQESRLTCSRRPGFPLAPSRLCALALRLVSPDIRLSTRRPACGFFHNESVQPRTRGFFLRGFRNCFTCSTVA